MISGFKNKTFTSSVISSKDHAELIAAPDGAPVSGDHEHEYVQLILSRNDLDKSSENVV